MITRYHLSKVTYIGAVMTEDYINSLSKKHKKVGARVRKISNRIIYTSLHFGKKRLVGL